VRIARPPSQIDDSVAVAFAVVLDVKLPLIF
jgi:hypothetical protein